MLSATDNEMLVRTDAGTPMGQLVRQAWIPALLSEELPERDGTPVRVKLLGEELVAFRDTNGAVGLLEEHCPHRGTSLALGVNEECGLRCLYHGWKWAVDGTCLDAPTELEGSMVTARVRAKAYPTREAGGMVWAYMGGAKTPPEFPNFEFLSMPSDRLMAFKIREDCNYAQAVEGTIDSAHAGILHRESPWSHEAKYAHEKDLKPKLEVEFTPYGLRYAAVRRFDAERLHARVTQVVLPFYTFIPQDGAGPRMNRRLVNAFVPRDDYSTWHFQWFFDNTRPVNRASRIDEGGHWIDKDFRKLRNIDNWYLQDRAAMKTKTMAGIDGVVTQDHAVCETQGVILDRTKEHLGTSDVAVVAWRRLMLRRARSLAESPQPAELFPEPVEWRKIKAVTFVYPQERTWKDLAPLGEEGALLPADVA